MCLTGAEPAQADRRGSQLLLAFFNPRLLPMAQKNAGTAPVWLHCCGGGRGARVPRPHIGCAPGTTLLKRNKGSKHL